MNGTAAYVNCGLDQTDGVLRTVISGVPKAIPELRIRPAAAPDCEAIADAYNDAIRGGRSTMDTELFSAEYYQQRLEGMNDREALIVAEVEGRIVGWGVVKLYSDRPGYRHACETSVYVRDVEQGRGYGSKLYGAVIDKARASGYRHLVAKILAVNQESIEFHVRFGFEVVGRQRGIGLLNGVPHDVVIMQRVF